MKKLPEILYFIILVLNPLLLIAQQDVTDTYLVNSEFDSTCNYKSSDASANLSTSTDGSTVLDVTDWSKQYSGWTAGASFEYGYAGTLNSPGPIPATAADGITTGSGHGALGVCAAWTGNVYYYQNVTLPAGSYKLSYNAYNSGSADYSESLVGFVPDTGASALSALTGFTQNAWTADEVLFTLDSITSGRIQVGVAAQDAGSGSHGRIFFDDLKLIYDTVSHDATLAGITLSTGSLTPAFNSSDTGYSVSLAPGTTSVDVTAVKNNDGATITGDGTITLINGEGTASIVVTAEDGVTIKTYVINFVENLMYTWDGEGITGTGSEPNNFGWDCTPATDGWTEANVFGIRYQDDVSYSYDGSSLTGRILYVRWDGTGGTTTGSVYSYPTDTLKACTTYIFEAKIAWNSNGSATSYLVAINSAKDNSGVYLVKDQVSVDIKGVLHDIKLLFSPKEDGAYYFTLGSSSAVLGAIRDLSLVEYKGDPFIQTSTEELVYDSTMLSQSFEMFGYDLAEDISFTTPAGLTLDPSTISSHEAQCGVTVTATFDNAEVLADSSIEISSGTISKTINIKKVFPPYITPATYELTADGTWCWFQDPRAVYYEGEKKQTYTGWINSKGKVQVASYNHETGDTNVKTISPPDFTQIDDHNNPTALVREDGRVLVAFSGHFYGPMRVLVSTNPEDISSFGPEANFGNNVTYANPYQIGDSTVMFYRDGVTWHPTINVSDDGGVNWGTPSELITRNGSQKRPYVKYTQDSKGGIHMTFTTGHPRQEPENKIYYAYFKDNKFYKADGTLLKDFATDGPLDIDAGEVETIYDASYGKGWTWDIALDSEEHPVILYAAFPDNLNHHYYYASWDGTKWITNHIVNSGKWFPQTPEGGNEPEPNYSGGMVLDPENPSIVYLSKQVNGVFEIYKYVTSDRGATWDTTAITKSTPSNMINVRPVIPRGHKPGSFDVMWLRGTYVTYSNFLTSVMYYSPNTLNADLDSILINGVRLDKFMPEDTTYSVVLPNGTTKVPVVTGYSGVPFTRIEVISATTLPGKTVIKVTSEGGITVKSYCIDFTLSSDVPSGSLKNDNFKVYPNPTTGEIHIDLENINHVKSVSLVDMKGRTIKSLHDVRGPEIRLSMDEINEGVYTIQVITNQGTFSKRFVKSSF
jgi:hypothetical protein